MNIYEKILSGVPDHLDFNFVPAKNTAEKKITLDNSTGSKNIYFKIINHEGFCLSPTEGMLLKASKVDITITVFPNEAEVIIANVKIILDEASSKVLKLSLVSKYPQIKLNRYNLDFGNLLINKHKEMDLIIKNPEKVPANFEIHRLNPSIIEDQNTFILNHTSGTIPENCSFLLKIKYIPLHAEVFSYESFEIRIKGGPTEIFNCYGKCYGLTASISSKQVNFESIELGQSTSKVLRVYNLSDTETYFQFYYGEGGVFNFEPKQGIIKPKSNERISVYFNPKEHLTYYDRTFCLFKNHLLFPIDLYGSCHDLLHKPFLLEAQHIDIFRYKQLNSIFHGNTSSGKNIPDISYLDNMNLMAKKNDKFMYNMESESPFESSSQVQLHKELLWDITSNNRLLYILSTDNIDFRFVEYEKMSEPYILTVINNSNRKILLKWLLDESQELNILKGIKSEKQGITSKNVKENKSKAVKDTKKLPYMGFNDSNINRKNCVFNAFPEEAIIPSRGTYDFKVYFTPSKPESYFFTHLMGLGYLINNNMTNQINATNNSTNFNTSIESNQQQVKAIKGVISNSALSMVSKTHVSNVKVNSNNSLESYKQNANSVQSFDPPIPIKIPVVGHSFPPSTQIYIAMAEITPKKELIFPFTSLHQSQYSSFTIRNTTDTPLYFKFISDPLNVFRVTPKCGLIPPKQFHMICVEFNPREIKVYKFPLKIIFNHDNNNMYNFFLRGACLDPEIQIHGNKKDIYFPPSFIGICTDKPISIINKSPIKINVTINVITYKRIKKVITSHKPKISVNLDDKKNMSAQEIDINGFSMMDNEELQVHDLYEEDLQISAKPANLIVEPNYFDLEGYQHRRINLSLIPLDRCDFEIGLQVICGRIYDPSTESIGIFNPGCLTSINQNKAMNIVNSVKFDAVDHLQAIDRREIVKTLKIIGAGADGVFKIDPLILDFGTVKVNFQEKKHFSIYNTSICNFYVQLHFPSEEREKHESCFTLDFKEGLIHSLCKKNVTLTYKPNTRNNVNFRLILYAIEYKGEVPRNLNLHLEQGNSSVTFSPSKQKEKKKSEVNKTEKASICIKANGDYPLIKIVDVRNTWRSTTSLWKDFNVNDANAELNNELTQEEINFINLEKTNKKIQDYYEKLKCITLDFGKHLLKKESKINHSNSNGQYFDAYITFKNEGGVDSEFFFKFPDDISIKREIWMDPDEPTAHTDYNVVKLKIFEIFPRKVKLATGQFCNIRIRYNIRDVNEHKLKVVFQIVNGKPLVFELKAQTHSEKEGILHIKNSELDFSYIPMGNMIPMTSLFEISNIGGIKLKYKIDKAAITEYNSQFENFPIFAIDDLEGNLSPNDSKYIAVYFKPLTTMQYNLKVAIEFLDDVNQKKNYLYITLKGIGYHPLETEFTAEEDQRNFLKDLVLLPKSIIYNEYEKVPIFKCGLSIDELNFGLLEENQQAVQTFIMFNYSPNDVLDFDMRIQTNNINKFDEIRFIPDCGKIEPSSHAIIKAILISKTQMMSYIRDILIKASWKKEEFINLTQSQIVQEKQELHMRIIKRAAIKDSLSYGGKLESQISNNTSFVEHILLECFKDIISSTGFDDHLLNTLDEQPPSLYEWSSDISCDNQASVRRKFLDNWIINESKNQENTSYTSNTGKRVIKSINVHGKEKNTIAEEPVEEENLEDKYMKDLVSRFKYSPNEMEEKLLMVNEETKKLVYDILENTVYNIICEAVNGETDLSEPTKIFFIKKNN